VARDDVDEQELQQLLVSLAAGDHALSQLQCALCQPHVQTAVCLVCRIADLPQHAFLVRKMTEDVRDQFIEPRKDVRRAALRGGEQCVRIAKKRSMLVVEQRVAARVRRVPLEREFGQRRRARGRAAGKLTRNGDGSVSGARCDVVARRLPSAQQGWIFSTERAAGSLRGFRHGIGNKPD
jgi:hypothetical protein